MIREADLGDAGAIADFDDWSEDEIVRTLSAPATRGWVVVESGQVVGYGLFTSVAGTGEVLRVAVRPDCRRRGLARALFGVVREAWRADGVGEAFLEVRVDNVAAIRLYTELRWERAGVRPRYYRDGTDAVVMRWVP